MIPGVRRFARIAPKVAKEISDGEQPTPTAARRDTPAGVAIAECFPKYLGADSASSLRFNLIWWRRWRPRDAIIMKMASS